MNKLLCVLFLAASVGCAGSATDSSEDDLKGMPSIATFTASPASIAAGATSTLAWSVRNATSLTLTPGPAIAATQTKQAVSPAVTTTYTLTATSRKGHVSKTVTVTVAGPVKGKALSYVDPAAGRIRFVRDAASTATHLVLDAVVGDSALSGFGVAIDLPLDATRVALQPGALVPNAAVLDPGAAPAMAVAVLPSSGPLAGVLTVGVARKKRAKTDGDVTLAAGSKLFSLALDLAPQAAAGTVFDGAAPGPKFKAALLAQDGHEVVGSAGFALGKLSVQ